MAVERDRGAVEAVREVNDRVAQLYRDDDEREKLDFLCECGAKDCVGTVRLTLTGFAERRQRGPILMPGHSPV